ncbi:hypothetical protein [Ancylobacter defluvii]|uniref:Uncharacterized protein n=1 Tax=Ancylobacter defluvii TaxID=1282440 RepID=A0A9W6JV60_9HYPH|nr:hypothetical protein [Ancylobacter defluvii]MBS7590297.1 hypothetical protein [Ancylobacter defluvii]GLK83211.1 hypothetical protein GCM10017653_12800 [Ancylobacter defluvii]
MREGVFGIGGMTGSARRLIMVPALGLLLAGCAGGLGGGGNEGPMGGGNTDGQGGFGSTMETTTVAPTAGASSGPTAVGRAAPAAPALPAPVTAVTGSRSSSQTVVAGDGGLGANSTTGVNPDDYTCPGVQVRGGAATWQVTDGAEGGIRYQANLGTFSRECHFARPDMNMRVGIQGRVLLGAKGGPGRVTVPLRLAVVEEGPTPKPIWTKLYTVPVEIGQGVMQVDFGLVADDVTFPLPTPEALERYVVYVGFDSQAGAAEARRTTRPRPAAQSRPAQEPAQPRPARTTPPASAPAAAATAPVQATPAAPVRAAPATPAPAASAPMSGAPETSTAPAASSSASGNNQWIGAPAPSTGGFSQ